MLLRKALGLQKVDPTDSVLGALADTTTGKGLNTSYTTLIQRAFTPKWWNSSRNVSVNGKSYTMMQANFSLYWGLACLSFWTLLVGPGRVLDALHARIDVAVAAPGAGRNRNFTACSPNLKAPRLQ